MSDTLIHEVTNRQSGTVIKIVRLAKPKGDSAYAAQCEHGAQTLTKTRRDAHAAGRTPKAWCATCAKDGGTRVVKINGTKVAETKRVTAKKTIPAPRKRATKKAGK